MVSPQVVSVGDGSSLRACAIGSWLQAREDCAGFGNEYLLVRMSKFQPLQPNLLPLSASAPCTSRARRVSQHPASSPSSSRAPISRPPQPDSARAPVGSGVHPPALRRTKDHRPTAFPRPTAAATRHQADNPDPYNTMVFICRRLEPLVSEDTLQKYFVPLAVCALDEGKMDADADAERGGLTIRYGGQGFPVGVSGIRANPYLESRRRQIRTARLRVAMEATASAMYMRITPITALTAACAAFHGCGAEDAAWRGGGGAVWVPGIGVNRYWHQANTGRLDSNSSSLGITGRVRLRAFLLISILRMGGWMSGLIVSSLCSRFAVASSSLAGPAAPL
ncbi:hypothetical protein MSAN_02277700 [Mycena sanguinolenta]|uniref:Uncharacterized protein n=1 Tax=Mycena sanguinolenta TaxID=230812 RepID=A0A8H6XAW4_9AGAR|nr:hypothetical protein MSAN_02277700 [Mycena sanguinolenta]